ncbi:MAG: non-heme iron oxygenase ferredoxin subunit [Polaromonas sp.]|nr:non-heme iron oxygenase ferredoxin subunit [Polaromonas sp.]
MNDDQSEWVGVCEMSQVSELSTFLVERDGAPVCIYRLEDGIYATDDTCSHGMASLAGGYIEDDCIECPLHQGTFDIRTGKAAGPPCVKSIATYPVKLVGTTIMLGQRREPV